MEIDPAVEVQEGNNIINRPSSSSNPNSNTDPLSTTPPAPSLPFPVRVPGNENEASQSESPHTQLSQTQNLPDPSSVVTTETTHVPSDSFIESMSEDVDATVHELNGSTECQYLVQTQVPNLDDHIDESTDHCCDNMEQEDISDIQAPQDSHLPVSDQSPDNHVSGQSVQTVQQAFIGPQIPDNYVKSETQKETVAHEPFDLKYSFSPTASMQCIHKASSVFTETHQENYLRGCKWSPDGAQILTNSNDNFLRTFIPTYPNSEDDANVCAQDEMSPCCAIKESALVYDYCWLPKMADSQTETYRVACSCPGSPMHLWDIQSHQLVSSYRAFDHCDEVTSAYSLSFSPDGSKLYGGYKNCIRVFDTEYSHRKCTMIKTLNPKTKEGHKGIVSCFSHGAPGSNTFVTGSYSKHVGIYYSLTNELVCLIQGQQGGVTHVMISPDGNRLYTGGRKDPEIVCWDMRNTGQVLCTFLRDVQTNQRIYFDLSESGRYLVSGNHDGSVQVWDTWEAGHVVAGEIIMKPCYAFKAHSDCTNGVSFNHTKAVLATASGQRHFKDFDSGSDEEDCDEIKQEDTAEFSLKIWSLPCFS